MSLFFPPAQSVGGLGRFCRRPGNADSPPSLSWDVAWYYLISRYFHFDISAISSQFHMITLHSPGILLDIIWYRDIFISIFLQYHHSSSWSPFTFLGYCLVPFDMKIFSFRYFCKKIIRVPHDHPSLSWDITWYQDIGPKQKILNDLLDYDWIE